MEHIEFILLWVSVLKGEGFQGRKECAKGSYCCNWTFLWVSAIFPLVKTVQNFIYFIHYHVFTSWSLRKSNRRVFVAACCHLPVTDFVSSLDLSSSEVFSTILFHLKLDSKAQFVHTLLTHVLIMALPWWLDAIHFSILFCLSDLTVPYKSRINTLQRTCVCALD